MEWSQKPRLMTMSNFRLCLLLLVLVLLLLAQIKDNASLQLHLLHLLEDAVEL